MKKLFLFFSVFILTISCSNDRPDENNIPSVTPFTYSEAMGKIGLTFDTYYNYSGLGGAGKIKFDGNLNVTEIANGQTVSFKYNFQSNNQNPDLTLTFTPDNRDLIPHYNPKMPITSMAKHQIFSVQKVNGKIQIFGMYGYNDVTNIFTIN